LELNVNHQEKVLITGATGLIGSHLTQRLIEENFHVRALVRNPGKAGWLKEIGAEIVQGDITDAESMISAAQGCQVIFHGAAWVSERGTKDEIWKANVQGTQNAVNAALAARVQRFIQISSCAVYGSRQEFDIDESYPMRKTGKLYWDSKIDAEEIVQQSQKQHGLPIVIARVSQVYGPRSYQFTIRPIEVIKAGKMILIDGGRHLCKPVFIANLMDGLMLCAQKEQAIGEAINLTDGSPIPWRDFFGAYGRMLGEESFPSLPYSLAWSAALLFEIQAKITGKKASFTRSAVQSLRSSNSFSNKKAKSILNWEPRFNLEQGMQQTENWLREQGYIPPLME
jgi:nucleoside-diphosphate-sugar epimerase